MDSLNIIYWLKEGFGPSNRYLGANFEKILLEYGHVFWPTNCVDYLKSEVENIGNSLGVDKMALNNYGDGHRPYSSIFRIELDIT